MIKSVAVAAAGLVLVGAASADNRSRLESDSVCDVVAGVETLVPEPSDGDAPVGRQGIYETDGLVMQGVIDLDGDGTFETIVNGDMGHHGGDIFDIQKADGDSIQEGALMAEGGDPGGFGAGFLTFKGHWYEVVFQSEYGAFPTGVYAFEKGTLKRKLMCRFESDVTETMRASQEIENGSPDGGWCDGSAPEDAKAMRLKPALALNKVQENELAGQMQDLISYAGNTSYSGSEVYKPSVGAFAGKLLWRVTLASDAGRGCTATAFYLIESNGTGYKIVDSDAQTLLAAAQSDAGYSDAFYCGTQMQLFEKDGRMFIDRTSGDEKPTTDEQLAHTIVEAANGKVKQLCSSEYRVVPRVTWTSPDLPK